jgi:hypothetical protein
MKNFLSLPVPVPVHREPVEVAPEISVKHAVAPHVKHFDMSPIPALHGIVPRLYLHQTAVE